MGRLERVHVLFVSPRDPRVDRMLAAKTWKPTALMRHTHIDLASVLAQPNPQVDLQLSAYEISTGNFLKAVTNYTNRAIAEITKHRNAQEADKKKLAERIQAVEAETNQCKLKEIDLLAGVSRILLPLDSPRAS